MAHSTVAEAEGEACSYRAAAYAGSARAGRESTGIAGAPTAAASPAAAAVTAADVSQSADATASPIAAGGGVLWEAAETGEAAALMCD